VSVCVPEGGHLLPSRHRTRRKHVQTQRQHSPGRWQSGLLQFLAKMYVCHSEDGMVSQHDHHMMAAQMQLSNKWGTFGVYYVVYTTTNRLSLVSDNH